jgi:hypothetical protein
VEKKKGKEKNETDYTEWYLCPDGSCELVPQFCKTNPV